MENMLAGYDEGNYTCTATNKYGSISRTYHVEVLIHHNGPPAFLLKPENSTVYEGDTAEIICKFFSSLPLTVQWYRIVRLASNDTSADTNQKELLSTGGMITAGFYSLTIDDVTSNYTGEYWCIGSNLYGSLRSRAWVNVLPSIIENHQRSLSFVDKIIIGVVMTTFILICTVVVVICKKCSSHRRQKPVTVVLAENPMYVPQCLPLDERWEVSREHLTLAEELGEGEFGRVWKGYCVGDIHGDMQPLVVAVKCLKDNATQKEYEDLINEMDMMKSIGHHLNIINLIGCVTQGEGRVMMLVEFAPHGNLREFLRQYSPFSVSSPTDNGYSLPRPRRLALGDNWLMSSAFQVARGMDYLSQKRIIHRDLAARNVLVAEDYVMKISDFGLTRDISGKDYYTRQSDGRVPVKWMAPDSLVENLYTSKSDVWSYGVLLWEIFSYGNNPYPTINVEDLYNLIQGGYRMLKPAETSDDIYKLMTECWQFEAVHRPDFSTLVERLDVMLSSSTATEYLHRDVLSTEPTCIVDDEVFDDNYTVTSLHRRSDSRYASLSNDQDISSPSSSFHSNSRRTAFSMYIEKGATGRRTLFSKSRSDGRVDQCTVEITALIEQRPNENCLEVNYDGDVGEPDCLMERTPGQDDSVVLTTQQRVSLSDDEISIAVDRLLESLPTCEELDHYSSG